MDRIGKLRPDQLLQFYQKCDELEFIVGELDLDDIEYILDTLDNEAFQSTPSAT